MVWLFLAVIVFVAIAGLGIMRSPNRRAPTRLNTDGLPRPYDRDDHRQNDEE